MKKITILILAATLSCHALAEEKLSSIEAFKEQTAYQLMMCRIQTQIALGEVELGKTDSPWEKIGACLKAGRIETKKLFSPALAKVSKKPTAAKLLKDYYAAWITSFNGISPEPGERKMAYEQRQTSAEAKHDEIWNRFEIEAGF
ncbi:MAG: hypothetical protein H7Z39_16375 [Burkholderiaceae bacterium]|nr:hypothetical protein [Burkholderiaceae bacterium]